MRRNILTTMLAVLVMGSLLLGGERAEAKRQKAPSLPLVEKVAAQPLLAQVKRLVEALDFLGSPLPPRVKAEIESAGSEKDEAKAVQKVQEALDPYCLLAVNINPEARVKVANGPAKPDLVEQGWKQYLVKVQNEAGVTAELKAVSPNARSLHNSPQAEIRNRWLDLLMFNGQPLRPQLSGLGLEYRIIQLYSRDAGRREAKLAFNVGQGTQDIGFRGETDILFTAHPSTDVTFHVLDEHGKPTMAMFLIQDKQGHVYPSQTKRLAPDFAFHPQIYRADGEKIKLPRGEYRVEYTRGPEYLTRSMTLNVGEKAQTAAFQLERWIDPSLSGWWSGDHHIHAAGCAHYTASPPSRRRQADST